MAIKKFMTKLLSSKIITVILAIANALIFVLAVGHLINEFSYYSYRPREHTESDFEYILNDGYYANAIRYKDNNEINGYESNTSSMKEYQSMISYYEANIKYKIAEHKQDVEEMKKQKEIFETEKDKVVIYSYIIDDMDKVLESIK